MTQTSATLSTTTIGKNGGRPSIKYMVEAASLGMGGYVFAPDETEADAIARAYYNLPEDEHILLVRVKEGAVDRSRYSKGSVPIHPTD